MYTPVMNGYGNTLKISSAFFPLLAALLFLPQHAFADVKCGPFQLAGQTMNGSWSTVNGVKTRKQQLTWLKQKGDTDNVKMHWIVAATKFQGDYGMTYLNKAGNATLDVEVLRSSRSQIKISGSYDCHKIG
ncbi:hypothetical protein [Erwinia sp.]|uniref:hypothetical protein n=1 Tax=Erwinia citreus TaxID=558 RepID=UPI00289DC02C|nr:hypothetical protein [Erwinia sp.]